MAEIKTFRDTIRQLSPRWLRGFIGERLLYSIAVHLDLLGDAALEGVKRRFPGHGGFYDSLPIIGRERKIRRGRAEPDANYASRLPSWLDKHRTRGGPYALLGQLKDFWAQSPFNIALAYASGAIFRMPVGGDVERDDPTWTPPAGSWARWWLIYEWPDPLTDDGTWGSGGVWGDGGVWGSGLAPDVVTDLRLVPEEWNAAHPRGRIILVNGGELWGYPPGEWGDPGTWGGATTCTLDVG